MNSIQKGLDYTGFSRISLSVEKLNDKTFKIDPRDIDKIVKIDKKRVIKERRNVIRIADFKKKKKRKNVAKSRKKNRGSRR